MQKLTCSTDECEKKTYAFGICQMHYRRHKRAGTTPPNTEPEERFWSKVDKSGGCWIWQGTTSNKGYGRYVSRGKHWYAHRLAYIIRFGEIASGLDIDHMCHNRACVNPDHLQEVTPKQNSENRAGPMKNSKTGVRGVHPRRGQYVATVAVNGAPRHLGAFATIEEAERCVIAARQKHYTNSLADRNISV